MKKEMYISNFDSCVTQIKAVQAYIVYDLILLLI